MRLEEMRQIKPKSEAKNKFLYIIESLSVSLFVFVNNPVINTLLYKGLLLNILTV